MPAEDMEPLKPEDAPLGFNLQEYKKAIEEEYSLELHPELDDPKKLQEKTRATIVGHLPKAIAEIARLIEHGQTDNVRFQSSKFIVEAALGDKAFASPVDAMDELIKNLTTTEKAA